MKETAVFMNVPGIDGTGTLKGYDPGEDGSHEKWIPIQSCSFYFEREEADAVDTDAEGEAEDRKPTTVVNPIKIDRHADITSAQLLMWLACGPDDPDRIKDKVTIDYCSRSGKYYLRYELEDVQIVSCSLGYQAPDEVNESITLTYEKITVYQRPITVSGDVDVKKGSDTSYEVSKGGG